MPTWQGQWPRRGGAAPRLAGSWAGQTLPCTRCPPLSLPRRRGLQRPLSTAGHALSGSGWRLPGSNRRKHGTLGLQPATATATATHSQRRLHWEVSALWAVPLNRPAHPALAPWLTQPWLQPGRAPIESSSGPHLPQPQHGQHGEPQRGQGGACMAHSPGCAVGQVGEYSTAPTA